MMFMQYAAIQTFVITMTETIDTTTCSNCGATIDTSHDGVNFRTPCQLCGSIKRIYNVSIKESIVLRDGIGVKGKRVGEKRPFVEDLSKPDFSRSRGKFVHLQRVIDRDNDQYYEKVVDYETGEIIHHCEEPLSIHQNHGSAKKKKE